MKASSLTFLVAQYHNPLSVPNIPSYIVLDGFGNRTKTDLTWYAGGATRHTDDDFGIKDTKSTINAFCKHTELEAKYCSVVRVRVSVEDVDSKHIDDVTERSQEALDLLQTCGYVG